MYNDIDKKFDIATKKALPYLVLAPPAFRKEISELMEALFHQLLQRSESDFETHYAQINDMIDNRNNFESNLEVRVQNFARRFISQEETISLIDLQLVKLETRAAKSERKIKSLEKSLKNIVEITKEGMPINISEMKTVESAIPKDNTLKTAIPEDNTLKTAIPEDKILKTSDAFLCGLCKTELRRLKNRYYKGIDMELHRFECPKCNISFKMDANGTEIPMKRSRQTIKRRNP